jgi:hypothetical protein
MKTDFIRRMFTSPYDSDQWMGMDQRLVRWPLLPLPELDDEDERPDDPELDPDEPWLPECPELGGE